MGGAFDHTLGGAAYSAGTALRVIEQGFLRPVRHTAANAVIELKQGSTQPAGHSFEATASICWLQINGVVPNDTKAGWHLHGMAPPQGRGFRDMAVAGGAVISSFAAL